MFASLFVLLLSPPAFGKRLVLQDGTERTGCVFAEAAGVYETGDFEGCVFGVNETQCSKLAADCDATLEKRESGEEDPLGGCTVHRDFGNFEWWGSGACSRILHHGGRNCVCLLPPPVQPGAAESS